MSYDVELENAQGMTHEEVGKVVFALEGRGVQMRFVRTLIFERREGWVGVIYKDGRESIITDVIDTPGGRKVFLPNGPH